MKQLWMHHSFRLTPNTKLTAYGYVPHVLHHSPYGFEAAATNTAYALLPNKSQWLRCGTKCESLDAIAYECEYK